MLRRAIKGFEKHAYPRCRAAIVPLYLLRTLKQGTLTQTEAEHLPDLTLKWTVASFKDGSFKQGEDRLIAAMLQSVAQLIADPGDLADFYAAMRKAPLISPWVVKYLVASSELDLAWKARGDGLVNTVTREGWAGFEEHQESAARLLIQAWKLHPNYPEAAMLMIRVTNGGADEKYGTPLIWFKRAISAQIDYMPAYSAYSWSLRPRWHGSIEEVHNYGVECLKSKRFDTMIPWQYIESLEGITSDMSDDKHYWKLPETWERLQLLCDGYAKSGNVKIGTATQFESLKAGDDIM